MAIIWPAMTIVKRRVVIVIQMVTFMFCGSMRARREKGHSNVVYKEVEERRGTACGSDLKDVYRFAEGDHEILAIILLLRE